jgi:hypothetical protein
MLDTAWTTIPDDEHWERVRWARRYWQQEHARPDTARDAAEALGMKEDTYSAYERRPTSSKSTGLSVPRARQFGKKFKVSWVWMASGEGSPFDEQMSPEAQTLVREVDKLPEEQRKAKVEAIRALLTGT